MARLLIIITGFLLFCQVSDAQLYRSNNSGAKFVSDAPLELIQAESNKLKGLLDLESGRFAFKIFIRSFEGFNSGLQREHFMDNYMEVDQYPEASFEGKLLDDLQWNGRDTVTVRGKGVLTIRGLEKEHIFDIHFKKNGDDLQFESGLTIALTDHNIAIPTIVRQKIAEVITLDVKGELSK